MKRIILCALAVGFLQQVRAESDWTMISSEEDVPESKVPRDKLSFIPQGESQARYVYSPETPPFGVVIEQKFSFQSETYFLTGWAHGAHTVLYRVFHPTKKGLEILCEEISESDESSLRLSKDNRLEIQIFPSDKPSITWLDCKPNKSKEKPKKKKEKTTEKK